MIDDLKKKLKNKKITVICPKYFGYEQKIVARLIELGATVSYIDERPDNSLFGKMVIRLFPLLYRVKINSYYNDKIKEITPCDVVVIINPESVSLKILYRIKEVTRASKYILYMWDSFSNKKYTKRIIPFFDKILTFDPVDAKELCINFRPLFFSSGKNENCQETIDISFIGTGHSDRAKIIKNIKSQCKDLNMKYYFYLYLQSPLLYLFHKITNKNFRKIKSTVFNYNNIKYEDYISISESSKAIIDIEHPKQKGLTMRTFEVLGKEKKLITTNTTIKDYDFYNDANILIIDRNKPVITKEFLYGEYQKIPGHVRYKYSIDGWLEDIFS